MKTRLGFLTIITFIIFLISVIGVSAVGTRLNITLEEVVYNNVTFAENFYLDEANPYCNIEGTLNISNPESDTIFDIYLTFYNVDRMTTDFIRVDGKDAAMYSGGASYSVEYGEVGNNTNNLTLTQDIDGDDTVDSMWNNGTGVWINLSTDGLVFINLTNSTGDPVSIENAGATPVDILVDEVAIAIGSRTYGNLSIIGTANQDNVLNASMEITVNEYYSSPIVLHIPELRPGNYTTFIYNVTCTNTDPPVNIETEYSSSRHPSIDRKVLAGFNWTIQQRAINDLYLDLNVTNVNITMSAQTVVWNSTTSTFQLVQLYGTGDYLNVHGNGTSNTSWWWAPNGGTIENGTEFNITFDMMAPDSVPFSATYLGLIEEITYDASFLMSNLSLYSVNASAKLNASFEKRIYMPADNEYDHNVTWEIRPHINTDKNITYNLNKVTLWVTRNYNLNNYSIDWNRNESIDVDVDTDYNDYTLSIDLDEDSQTDYVYVNSTYVFFNLSGSSVQGVALGADISGAAPGTPVSVDLADTLIPSTECFVRIEGSTDTADTIIENMTFHVWCKLMKNYTASPLEEINISESWDTSDYWYFNYTDGSSSSYPPPIVWIKPEWLINPGYGQIVNYTQTINGQDLYMKYIYVVNGYWLQIEKNITNVQEGMYRIFTYVENIGNGWTPQFEKVTVYDFIPHDFDPWNWTVNPNSNTSVGAVGSEFYGTSYVWDIPWKADLNSSLGPKYGPIATGWQNYSWNVSYIVNGTGDYKVTELYVVGLDPLRVDGAFGSPLIAVVSSLQTHSREMLYASVVMFLILVNVLNVTFSGKKK